MSEFSAHGTTGGPATGGRSSGLRLLLTGIWCTLFAACTVGPPSPEEALVRATAPRFTDDGPLAPLRNAIPSHIEALRRSPTNTVRFGTTTVAVDDMIAGFTLLDSILAKSPDQDALAAAVAEHFDFYRAEGPELDGRILLTGYYEPEIAGSSYPSETLTRPLYTVPSDLVKIELSKLVALDGVPEMGRGRLAGRTVTPYYTRSEIDVGGALNGKGLELCWVDPVDAFFLQIQGSGTVRFPSGAELILSYGEKNGHPYFPIGRELKEKIAPAEVSMHTIQRYLHGISPAEQQRILNLNPSYVFFLRSQRHAVTALGVEATAERTLAIDPRYFPRGALGLVMYNEPSFQSASAALPSGSTARARLILNQDTGGAITGPGRADLFYGRGARAGQIAGALKDGAARLYYLLPKARTAQP